MLQVRTLQKRGLFFLAAILLNALVSATSSAFAQTTAFTYQGKLTNSGAPVNALYDLILTLWDAPTNGNLIGQGLNIQSVAVVDGIFTVSPDFGPGAFNGSDRYLEVSVKPSGDPFVLPTLLSPRQKVLSTPYAIKSLGSSSADGLSAACVNCITSNQIGSVNGSSIIGGISGSAISGPIPVASVPAGSTNYIQNTNAQQASSNFNISGDGTAGGTLLGSVVGASTQYNLGGFRILTFGQNAGDFNLFAGVNAGQSNTGTGNSFFGQNAGLSNTNGSSNSFFGASAGQQNLGGINNSFFGYRAGFVNTGSSNTFIGQFAGVSTSDGSSNVFVGRLAGNSNTSGSGNVFIGGSALGNLNTTGLNNTTLGVDADVASNNLNFATAIGSGAKVFNNNTIALGRSGGLDAVVMYGSATAGGTLSGNIVNTATQYNLNGSRFVGNQGTNNFFAGINAGPPSTSGNSNAFVGANAGVANISGSSNSFFGFNAGSNSTGNNNSFFGASAGTNNFGFNNSFFGKGSGFGAGATHDNAFFGYIAGSSTSSGNSNSFFGSNAGSANTSGGFNSFFGFNAGNDNGAGNFNTFVGNGAGSTNQGGSENVFVGDGAGAGNISGSANVFLGQNAASSNITGSNNTIIGAQANVFGDFINATAIGYKARVGQSNSLILGSINGVNGATADTKVGIGTITPIEPLTIDTEGNALHGVYGWVQQNGSIVFGSKAGGMGAQPFGGWLGTKTNHPLSFFVNDGGPILTLETSGFVRVNNIDVSGNSSLCVNASNHISSCSSSLRYKTGVQPFAGGLDIVSRLRPIAFTWKEGGKRDIGFGAEDVDEIEPLLTFRNKDGEVEGVKYSQISAVLVNAVKEQQAQIASQQEQLNKQQNQIETLKRLVYRLAKSTSRKSREAAK